MIFHQTLDWTFTQTTNFVSFPFCCRVQSIWSKTTRKKNKNIEWEVAFTDIALPNRIYNILDGKLTFGYAPINKLETKLSVLRVDGAVTKAGTINDILFLNQYQSLQKPKGCYTKIEDVVTALNLQIFNFTSSEDVIKDRYNGETLKLSLTSKSTKDSQTRINFKCDSDNLGPVLGFGTDLPYSEGKPLVLLTNLILQGFTHYLSTARLSVIQALEMTKPAFARGYVLSRVKRPDLKVMFTFINRAFTNLQ